MTHGIGKKVYKVHVTLVNGKMIIDTGLTDENAALTVVEAHLKHSDTQFIKIEAVED